jgi:DNA processing protein
VTTSHQRALAAKAAVLALATKQETSWSKISKNLLSLKSQGEPISWETFPSSFDWSMFPDNLTWDQLGQEALFEIPASDNSNEFEESIIEDLVSQDVQMVLCCEAEFPVEVLDAKPIPPFLFFKGTMQPNDSRGIAIIGTRKASDPALKAAEKFARELAEAEVPVISGLASGIDTAALRGSLAANGRTIAVIGTGIDRYYPPENRNLQDEISDKGLLISQFLPGSSPTKKSFPMRNAIMSAYASASLVIQADDRSGARLQARVAGEQARQVFLYEPIMKYEIWAQEAVQKGKAKFVNTLQDIVG